MFCFWCNGCWRWSFGTATEEEVEGMPFVFHSCSFSPVFFFFWFFPAYVRSPLWLLSLENACVFPYNKDIQVERVMVTVGDGRSVYFFFGFIAE
jgi:hypothetical protein